MKDDLGDRIKNNYENVTRYYLPRRTFTIIRIDGKSFHSYTKGFQRPFDDTLSSVMRNSAKALLNNVQGSKLVYTQSDEISLLTTDFDDIKTQSWFNSNLQKMCSVSASIVTAHFNNEINKMIGCGEKNSLF